MRAALLNAQRLDFDKQLTFGPLEATVDLVRHETTDPDQVVARADGCQILISKELRLCKEVIERLPEGVRLICEAGTGVDNIDLGAAQSQGIIVCNVPSYSTHAVAQLAMSFVLSLSSGLHRLIRSVSARDFADFQRGLRPHVSEVRGKTLGVIGAGAIGTQVIRLARAFDMNVLVYNRSARTWKEEKIKSVDRQELLAESMFVSLHCPLADNTRHLIRAESIECMRADAYLVNTARGGLVNHNDLAEALGSGRIAGAALDVQDPEPLPEDNALWSMENVILTPHIGWKAIEARRHLIKGVAENIQAYIDTGSPMNQVVVS